MGAYVGCEKTYEHLAHPGAATSGTPSGGNPSILKVGIVGIAALCEQLRHGPIAAWIERVRASTHGTVHADTKARIPS